MREKVPSPGAMETPMQQKPYSDDEACRLVVEHLRTLAAYWASMPNLSDKDRTDGMAFSCLVMIDGGTGAIPRLALTPMLSDEDIEHYQQEDQRYFEPGVSINLDCDLHDIYHSLPEVEFASPAATPVPNDWIELEGLERSIVDLARAELETIQVITAKRKADTSDDEREDVAKAHQRLTAYAALAHCRDSALSANAIAALQVVESDAAAAVAQFNS